MVLPTNIDATYPDTGDATRKLHQQHHDIIHAAVNALPPGGAQPLDSDLTAIAALATTAFGRSLLTLADAAAGRTALALGTAATSAVGDFDPAGAAAAAQAASQPVDADLTSIAALLTTAFGRSFLELVDAAAGRTLLGLGTAATANTGIAAGEVALLGVGGIYPIARLATGVPDGTKFIRDDGTLVTPAAGPSSPFQLNGTSTVIIPVDNNDSFVVGSDRMDRDGADATKDTRSFFNKIKGAFRAGFANGTQWDDAQLGSYSAAFGLNTRATNSYAFAAGDNALASGLGATATGSSTTASGQGSTALGNSTTASGNYSTAEGSGGQATGTYSRAHGFNSLAARFAQVARAAGRFANNGDAQACDLVLRRISTDATAGVVTADAGAVALTGVATNVLTITASRAYRLKVSTVARRTDVQGEMAGWNWEGLVGRDSTGSARIIGSPTVVEWSDAAAVPWDAAVSINTTDATNNYVAVTVTGEAAKTIRWVTKMEWVEVAG